MEQHDPRLPLLRALKHYPIVYEEERSITARFIQFVENYPYCFERALSIGHVTGSGWVLSADKSQVLLLHHGKLNRWMQPGGHADGDSNTWRVAAREVAEIFDLDIHAIPARGDIPEHLHYDVRYLFSAPEGFNPIVSEESHDVRWIPLEQVSSLTQERSVLRMLEKSGAINRTYS